MQQFSKFQATVAAVYDRRRMGVQNFVCFIAVLLAWSEVVFCGEIHDAAEKGDSDKVQALLKVDPELANRKNDFGWTPLHLAVFKEHREIVRTLLANKAEVNTKAEDGITALHLATSSPSTAIAELLLAQNADVNAKDSDGGTPLHWAAFNGRKQMTEVLLAGKAELNAKNNKGRTPLGAALDWQKTPKWNWHHGRSVDLDDLDRGLAETIEFLRKHGAKE